MPTEIERIKQLCMDYQKHLTEPKKFRSYFELFKRDLTQELLKHADNPKKLLVLLEEPSEFLDFPTKTKAEVLAMNRSSSVSWFFKGLLLLITAPISLPLLMIWSLRTRETINFFKADGALFLERLIPLCEGWNEPPHSLIKKPIIPITKGLYPMPRTLLASPTSDPEQKNVQKTIEPWESQEEEDVDLRNMSRLAGQIPNIFEPNFTLAQKMKRFKGQAMIIASQPIEKTDNPNELRLRFTCELMYTGAAHEECDITLLKTFSPLKSNSVSIPLLLAASSSDEQSATHYPWLQAGRDYCLSFFQDDFTSMMKKGHELADRFLNGIKCYEHALRLAKTNEQKLMVIKSLVELAAAKQFQYEYGVYDHMVPLIQEKIDAALQQLPINYRLLVKEVENTNTVYETIWTCLENNQTKEAYELFKTIKLSEFIKKSCPDLNAMYCQLAAVFEINGENEKLEDGALSAVSWLHAAYRLLSQQNYSICHMNEYDSSQGAVQGKLYLQESQHAPLCYIIRNEENTADIIGQIDKAELIINDIGMGYSPGGSQDFIDKLQRSVPRIIATLAERGHTKQPCTPEAIFMRQHAIQIMGQMQLRAVEAWEQTPLDERRDRICALTESKKAQVWQGQYAQIRIDRQPRYFPKITLMNLQVSGATDPSIRYIDDNQTINDSFNSSPR